MGDHLEQLSTALQDRQTYIDELEHLLVDLGVDVEEVRRARKFEEQQQQQQQQQHEGSPPNGRHLNLNAPKLKWRSPSQFFRPDIQTPVIDEPNEGLPCEIRFEGLSYIVETETRRSTTMTVGAQCLRLLCLPCTVGRKRVIKKEIIKDLSGVLSPGRLTLLLGPPGSGKSTFLKALSGRLRRDRIHRLRGRLTYNGDTAEGKKFSLPKVVSYVPQEDCHAATLTVTETVAFAFACMSGKDSTAPPTLSATGELYDSGDLLPTQDPKVDQTLKVLGLKKCETTIVGNALLRGISGGEKKRLTTAEMMGGQVSVLLMDSISTGLDSAATFDICKTLRACAHALDTTILVCLLQPPPEVFDLFDDVIVMDGGQIVYHGEREQVLDHFESIGYRCPPRKDVADFLVEVTTPAGVEYLIPEAERMAQDLPPAPRTPDEFVTAYKSSHLWRAMHAKLDTPDPPSSWLPRQKSEFSNGWFRSTWLCLKRQITLTRRDRAFIRGRVVQVVFMGILCGTLFLHLEQDDYFDRITLLFFSVMFMALGNMATIPVVFEQREVFYKHRDSGFFPTTSAMVAQMLVQTPIQLLETCIFGTFTYFLSGLSRADHGQYFLRYLLVLYCCSLAVGQLFRLLVHIVPGLPQIQPLSSLAVLLFVVFSGLTISESDIPDYWIWLYWCNPLAWSLRALAINEFTSPYFHDTVVPYKGQIMPIGDVYLVNFGFPTDPSWIYRGIIFLLGAWVTLLLLTATAMHFIRFTGRSSITSIPKNKEKIFEVDEADEEEEGKKREPADIESLVSEGGQTGEGYRLLEEPMGFTPVTLVFKDLWYSVEIKGTDGRSDRINLLKGVSGYAKPGTMTALMGSSGAGKTTLLDVLAGRKTAGTITGEILVNGHPKHQRSFSRVIGYVEQLDVHSPHATVREALNFSAILRQPYGRHSEAKRKAFVEEILRMIELDKIGDKIIGEDSEDGLLSGERKRVTIGVELVANPSVLFLDEPTTGLDARSALVVMRTVKKVAMSGRSVIVTVHQPSTSIFEMFDMLLLLRHGGKTVYFGPLGKHSAALINYLQQAPGVEPIKAGVNPANWMLECIGAGINPVASSIDFADWYLSSELNQQNEGQMKTLSKPGKDEVRVAFRSRYAAPYHIQLQACMVKAIKSYWRSPNYNFTRMVVSVIVALIFGSVFHHQPYNTEATVWGRVGLIYLSTTFIGIVNMMSVMPVMSKERAAFYREQASSMYNVWSYAFSYALAELPYIIITTGLFVNVFYRFVGLFNDTGAFLWYWSFFALYISCMLFLGQFFICLLPNIQTAQVAGSGLAAIMNLFGGYLCAPPTIKPFWKFIYYIVPLHYTLEGLVMTQFYDDPTTIDLVIKRKNQPLPTAYQYLHDIRFQNAFSFENRWDDLFILIGYILALRVGTFLVLSFVRHVNR